MHVALSDLLTCPRCGPGHGLITLPDQVRERRVVVGVLGCPNCQGRYPIDGGVADLRTRPTERSEESAASPAPDPEAPVRMAALLGLDRIGGVVAVAGPAAAYAPDLAQLTDGVEVVALGGSLEEVGAIRGNVSTLLIDGPRLPFRDVTLAGIVLAGTARSWLEEANRALRPAARMLIEPPVQELAVRARAIGCAVVLDDPRALVVARRS